MTMRPPSPALFFDTITAYQRTEALQAAIELDLFSLVAAGRRTAAELAEASQAAPRGIRILADYLTILGFLNKEGDHYELTDDTRVFLDGGSPAYVGGAARFMLAPEMRESFQQLTAAVRRGGTAASEEGTVSHDNPIWVEFARAMAPLMQLPAQLLAGLVGGDAGRPLRVLDVAAGHGLFGITIAERYPKAQITALDWPNVLAVAEENAHRAGVTERYTLRPGSAFDVAWGGPYDLVLLTNFLHHFDRSTCEQLAANAYVALAPGGRTLTLDFIPEPDRVTPPATAGFALVMLATTARGDAYTFTEFQDMFAQAGFVRSEFHALAPTTQQAVVSYKD
ncbi:Ubiquinone/menaquinone biosynthesis C-methylase UbiE [Singulisphaera sp. GP187]|nr:Ubiquinone/menaquinone biosynthesis C-methylase UbiE [Singulisphaera sp. GP187]